MRTRSHLTRYSYNSVIVMGLIKTILGYVPGSREPSYSRTEVWTAVHAGMAVICASLPVLRPLATRISGSTFATKLANLFSHRRSHDWRTSLRGRGGRSRTTNGRESETELKCLRMLSEVGYSLTSSQPDLARTGQT